MCYFVEHNIQRKELEKRFNVEFPEDPRYTPSFFQSAFNKPYMPLITGEKRDKVQLFQWGLIPFWTKDEASAEKSSYLTFNARAESVWEKPAYRKPVQFNRCLVSAHGFFEYHTTPDLKIPYYISLKDDEIFAFAGIFDNWLNAQTGEIINSFSILTTAANPMMEKIHNLKKRMPVILPRDQEDEWLNPQASKETINSLFKPFPEELLVAHSVSRKISGKNLEITDPSLIEKVDYGITLNLY